MSQTERNDQDGRLQTVANWGRQGCLISLKWLAVAVVAALRVQGLFRARKPAGPKPVQPREGPEARDHEVEHVDESQQKWLGAKWSTWGCLAVLGSIGIAGLAIVTVLYGVFATPNAFGSRGVLSPDPALMPPFEPPPDPERLKGIPPIGIGEFTTGQTLRLNGVLFTVTRTALDWSPSPPRRPETEYVVVEVRLVNNGADPIELSPRQFTMVTARDGPFEPIQISTVPNLLNDRRIRPGETDEGIIVFARPDIRQVRRYLTYDPPFWPGTVRVLLVP